MGEMFQAGVPVPDGFIVNAKVYFDFVKKSSLNQKIKSELKDLDVHDSKKLKRAADRIQTALKSAKMPSETQKAIREAYHKLSGTHDQPVAVRSSATAEDLPTASFAGQQETYLNVIGARDVAQAVQKAWASLFTARAIFYRQEKGFEHLKVGIAVPVQRMVNAAVSGVLFTVDPLTSNRQRIAIEAAYGLGESIVSGALTPDQYLIDKESLDILDKKIIKQDWQITKQGKKKVPLVKRKRQKLDNKLIVTLAKIGKKIEDHYQTPQDIEWAYEKPRLFIVQTRPVTTIDIKTDKMTVDEDKVDERLLLTGLGASPGVGIGPVNIISSPKNINRVKKGDILVTTMTNPDFVPAMKKAIAVVTDKGGRTSHAAIVSRELQVPAVVGTKQATAMLKSGETITVDGSSGKVYQGRVSKEELTTALNFKPQASNLKTATKLYVNLSDIDSSSRVAAENVDGVGLLRSEFMIAALGVHPKKFIEDGQSQVLIDQLAEGVGAFCRNFAPRPVVYRATDFKTSEYRNLKGGEKYEAKEENPFLGFRGALRYLIDDEVFRLELKALKKVKNKRGCRNLVLMIPFVRTVDELQRIKHLMVREGLRRSSYFKLWMMVEVPANVILLEDFAKVGIDGISIGSNDLTMLTLGVDRDNEKVSRDFNELNPAVLTLIERAVRKANKLKLTSSICGQAPSDYPELVKKLVKWGITSISVNPDAVDFTRQLIYKTENEIVK